jgi:hypothetical protein
MYTGTQDGFDNATVSIPTLLINVDKSHVKREPAYQQGTLAAGLHFLNTFILCDGIQQFSAFSWLFGIGNPRKKTCIIHKALRRIRVGPAGCFFFCPFAHSHLRGIMPVFNVTPPWHYGSVQCHTSVASCLCSTSHLRGIMPVFNITPPRHQACVQCHTSVASVFNVSPCEWYNSYKVT